jgi:hypothetical protein
MTYARIKDTDNIPKILISNKCDLEDMRVVDKEEGTMVFYIRCSLCCIICNGNTEAGMDLARSWGCPFMEISAKTGENVVEAMETLLRHTPRKGIEYPLLSTTILPIAFLYGVLRSNSLFLVTVELVRVPFVFDLCRYKFVW